MKQKTKNFSRAVLTIQNEAHLSVDLIVLIITSN